MKKIKEDLTGMTFGRWNVVERVDDYINSAGRAYDMWLCECTCPNKTRKNVYGDNLRGNKSTSCGCLPRDKRHVNCLKNNNKYNDSFDDYMIGYTKKNEQFYFDKDDFEKIKNFIWYIGKDGYVVTHNPNCDKEDEHNLIRMHRLVLGVKDNNIQVDHKNRKRNDNRKNNLRIATPQENMMNCGKQTDSIYSRYKGVCYHKNAQKWVSYIRIDGKRVHLGIFDSELEAAEAYKNAAIKYFGEFACVDPGEEGAWDVC